MEKKQIFIYVSIVILAMLASFTIGGYFGLKFSKNDIRVEPIKNDTVYIYNISNKESTNYANVDLRYPQINGLGDEFNKSISDYSRLYIEEFKKNSEENWKARVETATLGEKISDFPDEQSKFILESNWELKQLDDEYVSVLITTYEFSGGAHGSTILKSFNYNIKEHKIATLEDFFKGDVGYLKKVSDYCISDLIQRFADSGMTSSDSIKEGAGQNVDNFSIFTVSKNKITFYFPQYSIGPYSFGIQTVDMFLNN